MVRAWRHSNPPAWCVVRDCVCGCPYVSLMCVCICVRRCGDKAGWEGHFLNGVLQGEGRRWCANGETYQVCKSKPARLCCCCLCLVIIGCTLWSRISVCLDCMCSPGWLRGWQAGGVWPLRLQRWVRVQGRVEGQPSQRHGVVQVGYETQSPPGSASHHVAGLMPVFRVAEHQWRL